MADTRSYPMDGHWPPESRVPNIDSNVPSVTRLVRAAALLAAQGASIGFAIDTLLLWARLGDFVRSNKMPMSERMTFIGWLLLPAVIWVAIWFIAVLLRRHRCDRLDRLECAAMRSSWAIAVGLLPVLFHPTLWRTRTLMFMVTTGIATLVTWWAVRVALKGWQRERDRADSSDFERVTTYLLGLVPLKLQSLAPLLGLGVVVLYVVTRGVWLDASAVPRATGEPPVAVHSLRQAFVVLGHGGWLSVPIAALGFLRPPGHAHIFFWALCVSSGAFPLYLWSKRHLGVAVGFLVALAYLSMPSLRTIGRAEVVPLGVAAGLFFLALVEWEKKRASSALLITLLTVGIHEQAALWFLCFGIYLGSSPQNATLGRWLALGAAAYFAMVALLVLPHWGIDPYRTAFQGLWGTQAVGLVETIRVTLTNPAFVLNRWVELQGLAFWLAIFVPFAFLPIAGRDWLLWAAPGVLFAIAATGRGTSVPLTAGANAHLVVLGFVASILTLSRLHAREQTRRHAYASIVAWVFAMVPCAYQLGGLWLPAI